MTGPAISPATAPQLKLFTHQQLFPADASYNLSGLYRVTGEVDVPRLRLALGRLARGIRALNTRFEARDGAVHAVHHEPEDDLDTLVPFTASTGSARDLLAHDLAARSDTPIPPDARQYDFRVHRDDEGVHVTLLFSHLVQDGYSFFNFVAELERLYADPAAELSPRPRTTRRPWSGPRLPAPTPWSTSPPASGASPPWATTASRAGAPPPGRSWARNAAWRSSRNWAN